MFDRGLNTPLERLEPLEEICRSKALLLMCFVSDLRCQSLNRCILTGNVGVTGKRDTYYGRCNFNAFNRVLNQRLVGDTQKNVIQVCTFLHIFPFCLDVSWRVAIIQEILFNPNQPGLF